MKFDDVEDLEGKFTDDVCALLIETIQGEGGIRPISEKFYRAARALTKKKGAVITAVTIKPATAISHGRELSDLDCSTGTGGA